MQQKNKNIWWKTPGLLTLVWVDLPGAWVLDP
jgi:hypothetical protein